MKSYKENTSCQIRQLHEFKKKPTCQIKKIYWKFKKKNMFTLIKTNFLEIYQSILLVLFSARQVSHDRRARLTTGEREPCHSQTVFMTSLSIQWTPSEFPAGRTSIKEKTVLQELLINIFEINYVLSLRK
jgi:hypothetical protein